MLAILATIGFLIAMTLGIIILHEIALALNHYASVPTWVEALYNWMLALYGMD
ncbi:MAG: hypothetical protein IKB97_05415 [Bacteroidaceae bacterium]|nr:hypothetical protein [Bacteroidaceae bacterium]